MMDLQSLKKSATNQATYIKGTKLFENDAISHLQCTQQETTTTLQGNVTEDEQIDTPILTLVGQTLKTYHCTCIASKGYPGLCKHGVALILQSRAQEVVITKKTQPRSKYPKSQTQQEVILDQLMTQYQQLRYQSETTHTPKGTLHLHTTIMGIQNDQVTTRLMLRHKIPESIPSIGKLAQAIRSKTRSIVGKDVVMPLSVEAFHEDTQHLAALLLEEGHLEDTPYWKMSLTVWQKYFNHVMKESYGNWKKHNPPIKFVVSKEDEVYTLVLQEEGELYPFYEGRYFSDHPEEISDQQEIYQVEPLFYQKVMPIYHTLKRQPQNTLKMDEHYFIQILPILQETLGERLQMTLKDKELEQLLPPSLEAKIYLDAPRPNTVTAKVTFTYDDVTYNSLSQLTEEEWQSGTPAQERFSNPTFTQSLIRDTHKENYIQQKLESYGFKPKVRTYTLQGEDEIYDWLTTGVEQLSTVATFYVSESLRQVKVKSVKNISLGITIKGDWIEIDLDCLGIPREELAKLLKAYKAKKRYYRMKNLDFINLADEGMVQLDQLVEALHLTAQDLAEDELLLPKYRAIYLDKIVEEKKIRTQKDGLFKKLVHDFGTAQERQAQIPTSIQAQLRPYQEAGFHWMQVLAQYGLGGILADDMGLGKTLQVITVLEAHRIQQSKQYVEMCTMYQQTQKQTDKKSPMSDEQRQHLQQIQGILKPSLIVAPTSLVLNWIQEFEKFAPCEEVKAVIGTAEQREQMIKQVEGGEILITSYDALKRDEAHYQSLHFDYCIIDEAQYIKNPATQNAKAVKAIQSQYRLALTGTPIENRLTELWSLFDFIMPGYLYTENQFKKELETPIIKFQDEKVITRLKQLISPFILRRLKKDVLEELPDKIEMTLYTTMGEEQQKAYTAQAIQAKKELMTHIQEEGIEKSHMKMLACLTRLRQICCDPNLCLEDYKGESSKLNACMELLTNTVESGHKVLLFSQFTSMLEIIGAALDKEGIKHTTIRGEIKAKERMRRVQGFNEGDTQVFLISLKAGGVGLNLTSADVVIHYDPWWNSSAQSQATDRAYRLGQKNNVQVFKLITKGTVEEKIKALQDKKKDLTEGVLSTAHTLIDQLTQEELLELFG